MKRLRLLPGNTTPRKLALIAAALVFSSLTVILPYPGGDASAFSSIDPNTLEIMPFLSNDDLCRKCHEPIDFNPANLTAPCKYACQQCHKELENHHQVSIPVEPLPGSPVRLDSRGEVTCISCHDLTLTRFRPEPRRAQSLFSRLFSTKSQYKSYYLVMDNRQGQLCKQCH